MASSILFQERELNALTMSSDTANATPPTSVYAFERDRTRRIASTVERLSRKPY
jgi:hypothetical protein